MAHWSHEVVENFESIYDLGIHTITRKQNITITN